MSIDAVNAISSASAVSRGQTSPKQVTSVPTTQTAPSDDRVEISQAGQQAFSETESEKPVFENLDRSSLNDKGPPNTERQAEKAAAESSSDDVSQAEPKENQVPEAAKQSSEEPTVENEDEEDLEPGELTEEEQDMVDELKARDLEVRTHEQAHLNAAGELANGGANYDYQRGPDGKRYAVGGHVNIDVSAVAGDPEATISKAERIKRAALAPAEPSGKDRQVASQADRMKVKAQQDLRAEIFEESETTVDDDSEQNQPTAFENEGNDSPDFQTIASSLGNQSTNNSTTTDRSNGFGSIGSPGLATNKGPTNSPNFGTIEPPSGTGISSPNISSLNAQAEIPRIPTSGNQNVSANAALAYQSQQNPLQNRAANGVSLIA